MTTLYPDVYYLPEWGNLTACLEGGTFDEFVFECELGRVIYPFVKRKVDFKIEGRTYFDTVTPYGFNGPCVECAGADKDELIAKYSKAFADYCAEQGIIAEYVRFSPWLKNADDFAHQYTLCANNCTFAIDVAGDFFNVDFCSKTRNVVRKAEKSGLDVQFDFEGSTIDEFARLYSLMVKKNDVSEYYRFSREFLQDTFDKMRGNVFIVNVLYGAKVISSAMMLHYADRVHYHLSGNDPEYMHLAGNSLLLYRTCEWAHDNGKSEFHLGGTAKTETGLYHFKQGFAKNGEMPFVVGKRIVNQDIYDKIVSASGKSNPNYFPSYRG